MHRVSLALVLTAVVTVLGCGDGPDSAIPFNRPLGDGAAGTPVGTGTVDTGILKDPTAYEPAAVPEERSAGVGGAAATSAAPAAGGSTAAAGAGGSEAAAIRELNATFASAVANGEIDLLLDCFPDEQVDALRDGEFLDTADSIVTSVRTLWATLKEKTAETDLGPLLEQGPEAMTLLVRLGTSGQRPEMLSDTRAQLVPDADALMAQAEAMRSEFVPVIDKLIQSLPPEALGGAAPDDVDGSAAYDELIANMQMGMQMADPSDPAQLNRLVKIDGRWKFELPVAITADQADAINAAALRVKDFLDSVNAQVAGMPKISSQELMQVGFGLAPAAMQMSSEVQLELEPVLEEWAEQMQGGSGGGGGASAAGGDGPSFAEAVLPLMMERCSNCHSPTGRPFQNGIPLDLSPEAAYASMTTGKSVDDESLAFIVPGDADASYLYEKVASDAPTHGRQMPIGDDPLSAEELALLKAWIDAGAQNDLGG